MKTSCLHLALLFLVCGSAAAQSEFSWNLNVGINQHFSLPPAEGPRKTIYPPNGTATEVLLTPKINTRLFNAFPGNTGSRKLRCASPKGLNVEALFGVNYDRVGFDAGVSLNHAVVKNFYWTGLPDAPHFNETFRNTTVGLPLRFKMFMGLEYDLFFYLKYQLDYTVQLTYREQFDCRVSESDFDLADENLVRKTQHGFGLGLNAGFLFGEVSFYPWFPVLTAYDEQNDRSFGHLRESQFYTRYGLNFSRRSMCIFGKMLRTPDFEGWGFAPIIYQPGRLSALGKESPSQTTLNGAPLTVDDHCSECKPALFRWTIPSIGLYAAYNNGGQVALMLGAEHSRYSNHEYTFTYEQDAGRYITYRRLNESNALGLSAKLEFGPFLLGAKYDWIYRYVRTEWEGDELFKRYATIKTPELKRFIPSFSFGLGNARFFFAEFQYFPTGFVRPEYYDQFGLRTFGKAPGGFAIRLGFNPLFLKHYADDYDCY